MIGWEDCDLKLELHAHTAQSSRCGRIDAKEVVRMHAGANYDGMVLTAHSKTENQDYFGGTPEHQAESWLEAYAIARDEGDRIVFLVLFGLEARLQDCDNDYLIFGAEPNFVSENPRLNHLTLPELHDLCKKYNALLVQAHPSRGSCVPRPEDLDGLEVLNGNPRHDSHNDLTFAVAEAYPNLIRTSGSDFHRPEDLDHGGILTDCDVHTSAELAECLRSGKYHLL